MFAGITPVPDHDGCALIRRTCKAQDAGIARLSSLVVCDRAMRLDDRSPIEHLL